MWRWWWYFQIVFNEYQHWTFPKHNYKMVVTLSVMILDNFGWEMISEEILSCNDTFFFDLCHNIYHWVVVKPGIFSPDYKWNPKLKIWVWARLVKRADVSGSTIHVSSDEGRTAGSGTSLRWQERGRTSNIIETVVITLDTPDIPGYITTKIVPDMCQAITNHQAD